MLDNLLIDYAKDTENPIKNYKLGLEYERIGQTAAAISFLLRAAERTDDKLLAYECLIRIGNCFDRQKNRNYTVKSMYNAAITLMPDRPEAYYMLSKFLDYEKQYFEGYTMAEIGLSTIKNKQFNDIGVGYPGKWGFIFEKGVCGWWRGKSMECRSMFQELVNNHWHEMSDWHRQLTENNIVNLGAGPESYAFRYYDKSMHHRLRYKFPGSENIQKNYSQVFQDLFILSVLDGKRNGTFLEIGGAKPFLGNNTYLLEKEFGWKGVSIEYDEKLVNEYRGARPTTKLLHQDALKIDYDDLLKNNFEGNIIDYLQLDIEPARNTYECLLKIPLDKYKFRVITYEHDYYADVSRSFRVKSREYLTSKGYKLMVNDISPDGVYSFEDWWVHPDLIDEKLYKRMWQVTDKATDAEEYIAPKKSSKDETKNKVIEAFREYDSKSVYGWGWCSLNKAGCLIDYVEEICQKVNNPVCVEIGVYMGKSVLPVALELKRNKKGKIYAIDPWLKENGVRGYENDVDINYWSNVDYDDKFNFFNKLVSDFEVQEYVETIRKTSDDAPTISNINLLYIDGEHSDQALKDTMKFASEVEIDGYCIVDDLINGKIWNKVSGVPELLQSLGFKDVHYVDNAIVYKRYKKT